MNIDNVIVQIFKNQLKFFNCNCISVFWTKNNLLNQKEELQFRVRYNSVGTPEEREFSFVLDLNQFYNLQVENIEKLPPSVLWNLNESIRNTIIKNIKVEKLSSVEFREKSKIQVIKYKRWRN